MPRFHENESALRPDVWTHQREADGLPATGSTYDHFVFHEHAGVNTRETDRAFQKLEGGHPEETGINKRCNKL